ERVRDLAITVNGSRHRPAAQRMPRPDRFRELHPDLPPERAASTRRDPGSARDPELRSYRSGFWATVLTRSPDSPGELRIGVEARLADGGTASAPLATIEVTSEPEPPAQAPRPREGDRPLIAICMATYNPDIELFEAQVASIRAQTERGWVCVQRRLLGAGAVRARRRGRRRRRAVRALARRAAPGLLPQLRARDRHGPPGGRADRAQRPGRS